MVAKLSLRFLVLFILIACFPVYGFELRIWHALEGPFEFQFQEMVDTFNSQNRDFYVILERKGNYTETVDAGIEAFYQGLPPHLLLGSEISTQTLMLKQDMFVSIEDLFHKFKFALDPKNYIDIVREFYSNSEGKFQSLPWNCSAPILFYNKKAFEKAGLNPERPPKTWEELEAMAPRLQKKGYCVFTTAWPAAYHLEHYCVIHNIPFASHGNGLDSLSARLMFDVPKVEHHLSKLVEWKKKNIFIYGTQDNSYAEKLFTSDKCAILLHGANRYPVLNADAKFSIGSGPLPYWKKFVDQPSNLNIGGASFWVFSGLCDQEYLGIVKFLKFLSSSKVQLRWHRTTGYLPITHKACQKSLEDNLNLGLQKAGKIAIESVTRQKPTTYTRGIRLGNYPEIRAIIIGYLEKVLSGKLSPSVALQKAVFEGNEILEQFEKDFGPFRFDEDKTVPEENPQEEITQPQQDEIFVEEDDIEEENPEPEIVVIPEIEEDNIEPEPSPSTEENLVEESSDLPEVSEENDFNPMIDPAEITLPLDDDEEDEDVIEESISTDTTTELEPEPVESEKVEKIEEQQHKEAPPHLKQKKYWGH